MFYIGMGLLFLLSGFFSGIILISAYRHSVKKRKNKKKYSFHNELEVTKLSSNVHDYKHDKEEHSYMDF